MKFNSRTLPMLSGLLLVMGAVALQPAIAQEATVPAAITTPAATPDNNTAVDPSKVVAAGNAAEAPELKILKSIELEIKKKKGKDVFERSSVPSLIFTPSQYALLREARIGFNTRAPTLQELAKAGDPNDPNYRPPVALRDIRLGGIAYNTPDDWTIWLNSNRVTPDALPSEAIDLRVYRDFIELKWFDAVTNQVYPVRLRMNQRFNLDTRIFLPGI